MTKLTALAVRRATYPAGRKGPFLLPDGNGLYLQIMPSGSRSWVLRYTFRGQARVMGLGTYGDKRDQVSLATARNAAEGARASLRIGQDPLEVRRAAANATAAQEAAKAVFGVTFKAVATDFISAHTPGWSNPKHVAQWKSTLETYAYPLFGDRPVSQIDADNVEAALKPVWLRAPETGSRLRGRIEAILDYAKSRGLREGDNPARWRDSMKHRLPNVMKVLREVHQPALPWQRVEAFIEALDAEPSVSSLLLTFAILTAARSGEARGATWEEFDLDKAIWTIPMERMKGRREHRVPLNRPALAILRHRLTEDADKKAFVFSTAAGKPLSDMSLSMLIRGMNERPPDNYPVWTDQKGKPIVPHGFRSTFRDWCEEETLTPKTVVEAALAHAVADKTEGAYRRTDLFALRTKLMQAWGDLCWPTERGAFAAPETRRKGGRRALAPRQTAA